MKKLVTLLAAAGMVVAASAPASAVDVKVDARYRVSFMTGEKGFTGTNQEYAQHRLRLGLTMAASENLSGYVNFQVGKDQWGTTNDTNGHKNGKGFSTRQMYLDWKVPATDIKVRMGRMQFGLPGDAFGHNGVMAAGWGNKEGIIATAPVTDWLGISALWSRIDTTYSTGDATKNDLNDLDGNKNDDLFGIAANLKFNGISGSVWAAYAALDGAQSYGTKYDETCANFNVGHGNAWWVGFTSTFSYFDPFTLKLSAAYGSYEASDDSSTDTAGWNVQAKASYKTAFGTPVLGAWYFSGMDKDEDGRMPSLGGYFTPTRTYHDAAKGLTGGQAKGLPTGNWGVQAGIEKVSFLQGLTHDFLVTYLQGTNDPESSKINQYYLSEDDSFVEIDLVNTYQIYKNLAAHLEFSYIISDFDDAKGAKNATLTEDDWRAELCFEYKF